MPPLLLIRQIFTLTYLIDADTITPLFTHFSFAVAIDIAIIQIFTQRRALVVKRVPPLPCYIYVLLCYIIYMSRVHIIRLPEHYFRFRRVPPSATPICRAPVLFHGAHAERNAHDRHSSVFVHRRSPPMPATIFHAMPREIPPDIDIFDAAPTLILFAADIIDAAIAAACCPLLLIFMPFARCL